MLSAPQVSLDVWKFLWRHLNRQGNALVFLLCRDHHSAEQRKSSQNSSRSGTFPCCAQFSQSIQKTEEWGIGSGFYSICCHCKRRVGLTVVKSNSRFQWHFQGKHEADSVDPNTAGGAHTSCRWESNSWWVPGACQETAHRLPSAFPCLIATIQPDSLRLLRRVMRNVDAHGRRSWVLIFSGVSARGPHGLWVREHAALFTEVAPETPLHHLACAPCASL